MANANRPTGLSPVSIFGVPYAGQGNIYSVAGGYGTALAIGDPVKSSGTASADGYSGIVLATVGDPVRGVIVGLGRSPTTLANWGNLDSTVRPANAPDVWYALVADDPNLVYEIQMASAAAADVGGNADLVSGSNNGFVSGWTLSGTASGTAAQCRILGLVNRHGNEFGAYAKVLVKINEHELTTAAGV